MGGLPKAAAAHFAAIQNKAREVRDTIEAADKGLPDEGEHIDLRLEADDRAEELVALILDHPDSPCVMLALAARAGAPMSAGDMLTRWRGAMAQARVALNARAVKISPAMNRQAKDRAIIEYTRATDALMDHLSLMDDAGDLHRIEALLKEGL